MKTRQIPFTSVFLRLTQPEVICFCCSLMTAQRVFHTANRQFTGTELASAIQTNMTGLCGLEMLAGQQNRCFFAFDIQTLQIVDFFFFFFNSKSLNIYSVWLLDSTIPLNNTRCPSVSTSISVLMLAEIIFYCSHNVLFLLNEYYHWDSGRTWGSEGDVWKGNWLGLLFALNLAFSSLKLEFVSVIIVGAETLPQAKTIHWISIGPRTALPSAPVLPQFVVSFIFIISSRNGCLFLLSIVCLFSTVFAPGCL